ncbi:MAG: hypothetical protein A2725_03345 [Candidatus Magasanikbacteria bacterium RIFCSPHIGHO2_01_FULL_33_34]|uniref:Uncharacterized protein n=1 Tax=Candidatus Magasanikbacteria bacterium RIFCSPHIGHO2_01_FULL_33_34 TaxID=1798671 RepID=A0A1F6LHD3_9BACT|nr:MAG: hypothetical protein A2725_03345 [Candidatus Magasanikbacteria bacterium RIFCSPHIGHO2_01_FULL_33_34]OGH66164.1 MAG: hypothetical protein A3B83_00835 [Candidatus Magasanikbacteria bacterium RIFCSPHIGHO2_02_FULL_33_17]OGH76010.1 MAG: hypothetical protein A3A89_00745 [Candidatus Magasanikbacteria bacterium RIFCSPLOWO2_01_FULL_33_34]OGH81614.1 MAG: hypothetical protein A3F93_04760 [Candidatus Magasanikbacteria bacterium RIFCSPLOWO2_12_FULL_34_7]
MYLNKFFMKIFKKYIIGYMIFSFMFLGVYGSVSVNAQEDSSGVSRLQNPLGEMVTGEDGTVINPLIKKIIDTSLGILGSVTLIVFVIGGFLWLTSAGNEQRVDKGTKTMLYATIGILVIFSSYAILSALIGVIAK